MTKEQEDELIQCCLEISLNANAFELTNHEMYNRMIQDEVDNIIEIMKDVQLPITRG